MATPKTTTAIIGIVSLLLASLAAYMVYDYLGAKQREADEARAAVHAVVVANTEIPFGSKIQVSQLKVINWPSASLPAGCVSDPNAMNGRLAVATIPSGSPVMETSLAPADGGASGVLSYIIPDGHRAVTVAVNEVVGVAGFLLPESIVDVVATVSSPYKTTGDSRISKIILQNVKVLAVGQILQQKEGKPVSVPTVTLDVLPEDAEKMVIASENKVQLILKHAGDKEHVKTRGETVASILGGSAPPPTRVASAKPSDPRAVVVHEPYVIFEIRGTDKNSVIVR